MFILPYLLTFCKHILQEKQKSKRLFHRLPPCYSSSTRCDAMIFCAIVLPMIIKPRDHVFFGPDNVLRNQFGCQVCISGGDSIKNCFVLLNGTIQPSRILNGNFAVTHSLSVQGKQGIPDDGSLA